jgi:hypothetical protein
MRHLAVAGSYVEIHEESIGGVSVSYSVMALSNKSADQQAPIALVRSQLWVPIYRMRWSG